MPRNTSVSRAATYRGAAAIPRGRLTAESQHAYPDAPANWRGPLTEWIVFWYLTRQKRYRLNLDFYYQAALPALGVFRTKGFTRVDFLIPCQPNGPATAGGYRAVCFDPITPFTHPNGSLDRLKRAVLASQGYLLVWIDGAELEMNPRDVIEKALRGIDVSSRGRGR